MTPLAPPIPETATERLQALRRIAEQPNAVLDERYWRARSQAAAECLAATCDFSWPPKGKVTLCGLID